MHERLRDGPTSSRVNTRRWSSRLAIILPISMIGIAFAGDAPGVAEERVLSNRSPADSQEAYKDPSEFFLRKMKLLADSGRLNDSAFVAATLGVRFRSEVRPVVTGDCSVNPLGIKSINGQLYLIDRDSWYGGSTSDIRGTVWPLPSIKYEINVTERCSGGIGLIKEVEAAFNWEDLPAFSCVADIKRYLPDATYHPDTDGVYEYAYRGKHDDQYGTDLSFSFHNGSACADGGQITQLDRLSYRYERAEQKHDACLRTARKRFCSSHAIPECNVAPVSDTILTDGIRRCGGLQEFFDKEPHVHPPSGASP